MLKRIGVFPILNHYYEPLFDDTLITDDLDSPRSLPGIDFRVPNQLALLQSMHFGEEFQQFVEFEATRRTADRFTFNNNAFESGDAEFLFQFLRLKKPELVVEIGSGSSTKIARQALSLNRAEDRAPVRHICIEPYEQPWLDSFDDIELVRSKAEDCAVDIVSELKDGDLLFIDSSHIIRPQGDVLFEYLEILPRLASGVYVHVHDIFSPRDYLDAWIRKDVRFWNEQYLLEAVLGNTERYEVVAALNLLKHDYYEDLKRICPFLEPEREPGSFYLRVR
jgi:hypothetical protein